MNENDCHYKILISAISKKEAQKIIKELLNKKLIAGGLILKGRATFYLDNIIKKKKYFPIFSYTIHENKDKIIEEVKNITNDPIPCISFFKIDYANDEFINWISENVSLDK